MGKCPCHSNKDYDLCCKPYHQGTLPLTPLALMRSRYSAYALGLAEYLIETTHPKNPKYVSNKKKWVTSILQAKSSVTYLDLFILETSTQETHGSVTFRAILSSQNQDLSFTEKSLFEKIGDRWLYLDGEILG